MNYGSLCKRLAICTALGIALALELFGQLCSQRQ